MLRAFLTFAIVIIVTKVLLWVLFTSRSQDGPPYPDHVPSYIDLQINVSFALIISSLLP